MDMKAVASQVQNINKAGEKFLERYEDVLTELLRKKEITSEESLQREILIELTEHIYGIRHIAEYLEKTEFRMGVVDRSENGEIVFNGEELPLMTELEVFVWDELSKQDVWTRVFVGGIDRKYLVGLKKNREIKGIPARIRE